jgi:SAM-dependent methyltransferase
MANESGIRKYRPPENIVLHNRACWCGAEGGRLILEKDRWGEPLKVVACRVCGTLRLDPRLTAEGAVKYYKESYGDLQYSLEEFYNSQLKQDADKLIFKHLPISGTILDYGCGTGGKLSRLQSYGYQLSGYDINQAYMNYAVSRGLIPFDKDKKYDVLFLSHTIEHWTDVFKDVSDLVINNLNSNGMVIIQVPLIDRLLTGARSDGLRGDVYFVHIWYFSVRSLTKLLAPLQCKKVYSDRVDLVVFKHDPSMRIAKHQKTSFLDRALLFFIVIFSTRIGKLFARFANRITKYVNVYDRQDVNR